MKINKILTILLIGSLLLLIGCTPMPPKHPRTNHCYSSEDEAIKIVGQTDESYYYKHSWNTQNKLFENWHHTFSFKEWKEIPCDKSGYEYELMLYRLKRVEQNIEYLERLTEPLRKGKQ